MPRLIFNEKIAFIISCPGVGDSNLLDYLLDNIDWEIWGMLRWRSFPDKSSRHVDRVKLVNVDSPAPKSINLAVKLCEPN